MENDMAVIPEISLESLFPLFAAFGFILEGQHQELLLIDKLFNNSNCLHCIILLNYKFVNDLL